MQKQLMSKKNYIIKEDLAMRIISKDFTYKPVEEQFLHLKKKMKQVKLVEVFAYTNQI